MTHGTLVLNICSIFILLDIAKYGTHIYMYNVAHQLKFIHQIQKDHQS